MNPEETNSNEQKQGGMQAKLTQFAAIVLVVVAVVAIYFYSQTAMLGQSDKVNDAKVAALVVKVGMIIALPEGEVPTVAVVSDTEPLKGNSFFAKAKVGYNVLFYPIAQKAFLYDPEANQIVEVASIVIGK